MSYRNVFIVIHDHGYKSSGHLGRNNIDNLYQATFSIDKSTSHPYVITLSNTVMSYIIAQSAQSLPISVLDTLCRQLF